MIQLDTARLRITGLTPAMAHELHVLSLDEDNRRFVPDEVFETEAIAAQVIAELIDCYGEEAPQVYAVLLRDGTLIGYVQAVPTTDGWEIGYHIGKPFTRCGYACEAVNAFLPAVMAERKLHKILGICLADNIASRRVLEYCGFTLCFEGMGEYQGETRHVCRYLYTQEA